jgi:RHS repeat-associated protein
MVAALCELETEDESSFTIEFPAQREHDTESSLVHMRHRMYDSRIGRFTQVDPILDNRPNKAYLYCSNSPLTSTDPMGLDEIRRRFIQMEIDRGELTDYELQYALWFIHSDKKVEELGHRADWVETCGKVLPNEQKSWRSHVEDRDYNWEILKRCRITKQYEDIMKQVRDEGLREEMMNPDSWVDSDLMTLALGFSGSCGVSRVRFGSRTASESSWMLRAMRASGIADAVARRLAAIMERLEEQIHHFATNKGKSYHPMFKKFADRYQLDLDGAWNKESIPHLGRHPTEYHNFVLDGMRRAATEAGKDRQKFLELFEKYVKAPVRENPWMLRKDGWAKTPKE